MGDLRRLIAGQYRQTLILRRRPAPPPLRARRRRSFSITRVRNARSRH